MTIACVSRVCVSVAHRVAAAAAAAAAAAVGGARAAATLGQHL